MRFPRLSVALLSLLLTAATGCTTARTVSRTSPSWKPLGPFGGDVWRLTADPVRPGVLYAATSEGLYRTADAGRSWSLSYAGKTMFASLAVDPFDPEVLYLAPGSSSFPPLLKSIDGGSRWTPAADGLHTIFLPSVAADPVRPRRLYVAGTGGIWRSDDAGRSWKPASGGLSDMARKEVRAIALSPGRAGTLLAATASGLYRSDDAGDSWRRLGNGLPAGPASVAVFAPSDPQTAYAFLDDAGFFSSQDGGASWEPHGALPLKKARTISVSARSPRTLYLLVHSNLTFRSTDGGAHWIPLAEKLQVKSLAADPFRAETVYACWTNGRDPSGVWRSDDRGATWAPRSQGLTALSASTLAIDLQRPGRLWASLSWGPLRSGDGGAGWALFPEPPVGGVIVQLASGGGSRIFARNLQYPGGSSSFFVSLLWRTDDGGDSWTRMLEAPAQNIGLFRAAPSDPDTLYAVDVASPLRSNSPVKGIHRSTDGGDHWELRSSAPLLGCGAGDLAVSPDDANTLYLSGCKDPGGSAVLRSDDGGATWTDVSAGLPGRFVGTLAADPGRPRTVYAGVGDRDGASPGDGVWVSTDGGASWAPVSPILAGRTITALSFSAARRLYAATLDGRIFRTGADGVEWLDRTEGLPPVQVFFLVAAPSDPGQVYVVTSRGVWRLDETD